MKQWLKDLFSEESTVSSMRVMAMMCVIAGCGIAIYSVMEQKSESGMVAVLLGAGLGAKVGQKIVEGKNG